MNLTEVQVHKLELLLTKEQYDRVLKQVLFDFGGSVENGKYCSGTVELTRLSRKAEKKIEDWLTEDVSIKHQFRRQFFVPVMETTSFVY